MFNRMNSSIKPNNYSFAILGHCLLAIKQRVKLLTKQTELGGVQSRIWHFLRILRIVSNIVPNFGR